ncbi:MAG: hypothetical protein K5831_12745 [Brevundimonas sp.]|uniref:hypothetical protein n=1 Tax=Brevundimonas sp. TaxID=1871086 RepID=UPI002584146A|nr:hypothetical protein [Brevundimonas sp.]MCV0415731.1 hypothetical protein [Brevundimonas sp.]
MAIAPPRYSTLFSCLYDEPGPVGQLGRGTHYSIFRSVEWLDVTRRPLTLPQVHDFAVIWDEDHDERVIEAVERLYMAGLLSPVQFIGERKGMLTIIVAAKFYYSGTEADTQAYNRAVDAIGQSLDDAWPVEVGMFDRAPGNPHQNDPRGIISDQGRRVQTYLENIDGLWRLGTKDFSLAMTEEYRRPDRWPTEA